MPDATCDVVIFGGGVTGLWCRAMLARVGYSTVLLEATALGAGQTVASQGILHAGLKYAVSGEASRGARMLADEQPRWRARLAGDDWPDLRGLPVLTDRLLMWTTPGWATRTVARFATGLLRSGTHRLTPPDRPPPFDAAPPGFEVWGVDEPAIDAWTLVQVLRDLCPDPILHTPTPPTEPDKSSLTQTDDGVTVRVASGGRSFRLDARAAVLAAGTGNEDLLRLAGAAPENIAQRRPLHMVVARDAPCAINGHCTGLTDKPRLTITTGSLGGRPVWYLGGELAESGVALGESAQIDRAKEVLATCLPWVDLGGVRFACVRIDRAEGRTRKGARPEGPVVHRVGRVLAVWPTKLALAPAASERVLGELEAAGVVPGAIDHRCDQLAGLPGPPVAEPVWQRDDLRWS